MQVFVFTFLQSRLDARAKAHADALLPPCSGNEALRDSRFHPDDD